MPIFPEAVRQQMSAAALKPIGWTLNTLARVAPQLAGEWAFRLFSHPRSSKSNIHHPEILDTSERIALNIKQYDLYINLFRWAGDGPTVFLAHGWESNSSRWLLLIRSLRSLGFQVISIDAPAHGLSGGKQFNVVRYTTVLKEAFQQYQPSAFVGHSAGGMAGVYHLYQEGSSSLEHLILMSVPYELEDLMDVFRRLVGMNDLVFTGLKKAFRANNDLPMSAFSVQEFIQKISIPGLIIHDRSDTIAPYEGAVAIHENWKESTLVATNELGHSLPGEEVVETVIEYLKEQYL